MEKGYQEKALPDFDLLSLPLAPAQIKTKDPCKGTMGQGSQKGPGQAYLVSIENGIKKVFKGGKTQAQGNSINSPIYCFIKVRMLIMQGINCIGF